MTRGSDDLERNISLANAPTQEAAQQPSSPTSSLANKATVPMERQLRDAPTDLGSSPPPDSSAESDARTTPFSIETHVTSSGPQAAQVIGRFAILRELGRGGMGQVYVAYDEVLERKVAVKLLHNRRYDPKANQRLLREARAMAKITHPNVAAIYDAGEMGERVFVAMELIAGQTLNEWCAQPNRHWREILAMYLQAGRGLAAAHRAGIVHRDFKPSNVLVGNDGRARVLDFGLARMENRGHDSTVVHLDKGGASDNVSPEHLLTQAGTIMGTPLFMSPEQHEGRDADTRSDQYNFCVALYEALYRVLPFQATTLQELQSAKLDTKFVSPTNMPPELAPAHALIVRGLAVAPDERWPVINELLDKLEALISDTSTHSQRLSQIQYRLFTGLGLVAGATVATVTAVVGDLQSMTDRQMLGMTVTMVSLITVFMLVTRRYLKDSLLAQRVVVLLWLVALMLATHRVLGMYTDPPTSKFFVYDFLIASGMFAVAGVTIHRWLWAISAQLFVAAIVSIFHPAYTQLMMALISANLPLFAVLVWMKARAEKDIKLVRTMLSRQSSRSRDRSTQTRER